MSFHRLRLTALYFVLIVVVFVLAYVVWPTIAGGQPTAPTTAPAPLSAIPDAPADARGLAVSALNDMERGDWRHLLAVALVTVAWFGRKAAKLAPGKIGKFLATDLGGLVVVVTISEAAAFAAVLFGPMRLTGHVLLNALFVGLSAVGVHQAATKVWAHFMAGKPGDADQVPNKPEPPIEGPAKAAVLLLVLGFTSSACTSAWRVAGADVARACFNRTALTMVVGDLTDAAALPGATVQSAADAVVLKDGVAFALCAAAEFLSELPSIVRAERRLATGLHMLDPADVARELMARGSR